MAVWVVVVPGILAGLGVMILVGPLKPVIRVGQMKPVIWVVMTLVMVAGRWGWRR